MKKKVLSFLFAAAVVSVVASGGVMNAHADEGTSGTFEPTKIRVIKEEKYLEIYWDREVKDSTVIGSYVLKNGDVELELYNPGQASMYFYNQGEGFTSFGYEGTINESEELTLEIKGDISEQLEVGSAKTPETVTKKVYDVEYENYYTQFVTADCGIVCQSSDDVELASLELAADMIDVMLSKTDTGIPAALKKNGAKMALYGPHENAYFIPEHRNAWNPEMYYVEGYGGSSYNKFVSSIAERNVIRSRTGEVQTGYKNENILVHEFGHCVKLGGLEYLEDPSLMNEFFALYRSRMKAGMWPNTYAGSNPDEFFATMCAVWFNVMDDAKDWNDGVRCPVNTRAELQVYDPETYAFFEKIFPSDKTMPAPWDKDLQDLYTNPEGGGIVPPEGSEEGNHNFATDEFKFKLFALNGNKYMVVRDGDTPYLWWNYSWDTRDEQSGGGEYAIDETNVWRVKRTAKGYYQILAGEGDTNYGGKALAEAENGDIVYVEANLEDEKQLWKYESTGDDDCGIFVNVSTGHVIGMGDNTMYPDYVGKAWDATFLHAVERGDVTEAGWALHNMTTDSQLFPREAHDYANTYFRIISAFDGATRIEAWDGVCVWNTGDGSRNSWKIVPTNDGYFYIEGVDEAVAGKVLAPVDNGTEEGVTILPEEKDEADATQLWKIEIEGGSIRFINKASGLALAIKDGNVSSGNTLVLEAVTEERDSQLWKVTNKTTGQNLVPADIPNAYSEPEEDEHVHEWETEYTVDKEATCTEAGSKSIHCKGCDEVKDVTEIKALGHKWDDGVVTKEATTEAEGEITFTCEHCQKTRVEKIDKDEQKKDAGVNTGDHSNLILWIALMSVCGIVCASQTVSKKRR